MTGKTRFIRMPAPVFLLNAAFTAFVLAVSLPGIFPPDTASIKMDMKCSAGNRVELYLNDMKAPPLGAPLVLGERHTYTFSGVAEDVKVLRVDPTDASGAEVEIYSIEVDGATGVLRRFAPAEMTGWPHSGLSGSVSEFGGFRLVSTNNDPILITSTAVALQRKTPAYLNSIIRGLRSLDFLTSVIAVGFTLLLAVMAFDRARRAHCLIALAAVGTAAPAIRWIVAHYHGLPDPSVAVSRAGFLGLSAVANQLATLVHLVIAALAGVAAYLLFGGRFAATQRLAAGPEAYKAPPPADEPSRTRALVFGVGMTLLIVLAWIPDLRGALEIVSAREYTPHWDSNNITYWEYLVQRGWLPFRDFWYPYAGMYIFSLPLPWGLFLQFLYKVALFSAFCRAIYVLSGRRLAPPVFAFAVLALGDRLDLFPAAPRYLLSITVFLCYLLIDRQTERLGRTYGWFWFTCCLAIFIEPAQVIYSGCAIAVKLVFDSAQQWTGSVTLARRIAHEFAVPAVFLLLYLVFLAINGQASGLLRYYLKLGDSIAFGAFPTDLTGTQAGFQHLDFLLLVVPGVFVGIGLFERLRAPGMFNHYGDALLGVGMCGFMILQKHVVRAINQQFFVVLIVGLLVYVLLWRGDRSWAEYFALGGVLGGCLAVILLAGGAPAAHSLLLGPARLRDTLDVLTAGGHLIHKANAEAFAPARFARFPDQLKLVERLRAHNRGQPAAVFSLTDDPVLYILTGQPVVYESNIYNTSPIYEQKIMVDWLNRTRPPFVVFEPGFLEMDSFQKLVRGPLLFEAVIKNYVPLETAGRFEILRERRPDEHIAFAYWRGKLGPVVDLGHFARISSFPRYDPCPAAPAAECQDFLEVRIETPPPAASPVTLPFESAGMPFEVKFMAVPGQRTYYVSLDRLWFWKLAKRSGQAVGLVTSSLPAGVAATVFPRASRTDILY